MVENEMIIERTLGGLKKTKTTPNISICFGIVFTTCSLINVEVKLIQSNFNICYKK